ncbi:glycoside hydrolase family 2 protein [Fodinibius sediminis]|uniref:Glycosyl hydrolases family 2, TIM barrel domain n=1 Tax=Fodinibius sediminis TaxID=1214077 RepID=A0A521CRQ8_9BACT|nr:sugar-binding domain-containing protein [Fodinibius sediminis]SMO62065.1 Glycosyl hydrolases family 2, TIM barrel domain [Fodinibius sediminis]
MNNIRCFIPAFFIIGFLMPGTASGQSQATAWKQAESPLMTKWSAEVGPENALPEYPRPMMKREEWQNLNGLWDFKISRKGDDGGEYNRKILVPYPVESALSGIKKKVGAANRVWYRRTFRVDNPHENGRVLLHFGASDWETDVRINGSYVGKHRGGYDSFTFDITDYLKDSGQEIELTVWDPTDLGHQPVGKQTHDPRSIWYTAVTGIWQTVWLEYVPHGYISDLKITPDVDNSRVKVELETEGLSPDHKIRVAALKEGDTVGESRGNPAQTFIIPLEDPRLWSPETPFLYDLEVELLDSEGTVVDRVSSYFGMRKIAIAKSDDGYTRLFLNNKPLFQLGPLDQGWWPDGLYTAPTDEALKYDLEITKKLGYNMLRKHVKVEPQRFYYWADKLGIIVWQDMPSGDMRPGQIPGRTHESARQFKKEYKRLIDARYNHPSIVMWVPFNEGWGQFQTRDIVEWTKNYDPTRLVNNASGWHDQKVGDVIDMHEYPGPDMPDAEDNRAAVLGEFGGQALVVKDHLWIQDFSRAPSHYETSQSKATLHETYDRMIEELRALKDEGLSAAVYTQTTDVESEVNGLMAYDREVVKFDFEHLQEIHQQLIEE